MTLFQIVFIAAAACLIVWVGARMARNIIASNWNYLAVNSFWMLVIGGLAMLLQPALS